MWLLESSGDVLGGKRHWLRPGKTYLFGRTHTNGQGITVDHPNVSRKHATITVNLPLPGDVTTLTAKSVLKIEDLRSKYGTFLGDRKLSGESAVLYDVKNSFRLGGLDQVFTIKWHPVVFTFKASSRDKERKALQDKRNLLGPLDIKAIDKFDPENTTHVVSNKRNTPQVLQGLVHGKYIVDDPILKELEYVTTADNLDEMESMSKLEVDFDGTWPDPMKFLPPAGKEPVPRPVESFAPDRSRNHVFRGYTFVMFDKKQYDGIAPAIQGADGVAQLYELKPGEATSSDIIRYMKKTFDAAEAREEGSGYGVLQVRFSVPDADLEAWATRIQVESVAATGQGLVEQNEFLDAILTKNARPLIKKAVTQAESAINNHSGVAANQALVETNSRHSSARTQQRKTQSHPTTQASNESAASSESLPRQASSEISANQRKERQVQLEEPAAMSAPTGRRRNRARGPAVNAFKGFVDEPVDVDVSVEDLPQEGPKTPTPGPQAQSMQSNESIHVVDEAEIQQTPRKRPLPPDLDEDIDEKLYPAQAAAKRRRLENGGNTQVTLLPVPEKAPEIEATEASKANAQSKYDARMRNLREQQEEIKDEELEPMHEQLEKMSFGEKQRLVNIVPYEIKPRRKIANEEQAQDPRWKDEWNGRKNFKGFKKRGQPTTTRSGPRIIIGLEPIRVESATEVYLTSKQTEAEKRKAERRRQQQEEESEDSPNDSDAGTHQEEIPDELKGQDAPEVIDVDAPRTTRASDRGSVAPSRSRTTAASLKRQASTTTNGPAKKKKLNLKSFDSDPSSEEDEIPKFRFKKK